MKGFILAVLATFLVSVTPADSFSNRPFLAVFANPGSQTLFEWRKYKPDLMYESTTWRNFDDFLGKTKEKAGGRPIILDVECHGSKDTGLLAIQFDAFGETITDDASFGYVLKHIDNEFHNRKKLTVLVESCYSSICAAKTTTNKAYIEANDFHVDSYEGDLPPYPIYGIGRSPNYNNLVYMQYRYNIHEFFVDLRDKIGKPAEKPDDSAVTDINLRSLCATLSSYGICP